MILLIEKILKLITNSGPVEGGAIPLQDANLPPPAANNTLPATDNHPPPMTPLST